MRDFRTWPLRVYFTISVILCTVAPLIAYNPLWLWNIAWLSPSLRMDIYLFTPLLAALMWIIVVAFGIWVHRWRGLWLLITGYLIVSYTIVFAHMAVGCVRQGVCP